MTFLVLSGFDWLALFFLVGLLVFAALVGILWATTDHWRFK